MQDQKAQSTSKPIKQPRADSSNQSGFEHYSGLDNSIPQYFTPNLTENTHYRANMMAHTTLHFFNQTRGIDIQETHYFSLPLNAKDPKTDWDQAHTSNEPTDTPSFNQLPTQPPANVKYAPLSAHIKHDKQLKKTSSALKNWLYHERKLTLYRSRSPKLESKPYETLADFKVSLNDVLNTKKNSKYKNCKRVTEKKKTPFSNDLLALKSVLKKKSQIKKDQ